jgi:hypothetical protein
MMNCYMKDNIFIKKVTTDKWGTATNVYTFTKGRITFRTKMVRSLSGEMVVSSAEVMLPNTTIDHKDKIVYDSKEYSILGIEEKKDFSVKGKVVNLQ